MQEVQHKGLPREKGDRQLHADADGQRARHLGGCEPLAAVDRLSPADRFPRRDRAVRRVVPRIVREVIQ